eukprot:TRINITY_DN38509_c0_g1_i1.p1 TRINITY_DN38509_c0_g1~~TRINITY_DN38509_c0_g1_i1.p1  ORF type:complete len:688 (-),score=112.04 TRINITY_DN38509_c0_g1_i1:21-2084(-)
MEESPGSLFVCSAKLPLVSLDVDAAWGGLTLSERQYAHHFARAAWAGQQIVAAQTSPESPDILDLFFNLFSGDADAFCASCIDDVTIKGHWEAFLDYCCFCIGNLGNYSSVGNRKVVPALPPAAFSRIVAKKSSDVAARIWKNVEESVYSTSEELFQLGFPPEQRSQYCLGGATQADAEFANRWLATKGTEAWNTRLERSSDGTLVIRRASANVTEGQAEEFEGRQVVESSGDHSAHLRAVITHLQRARGHCSTEVQERMIDNLVRHFEHGQIELHKEASREWVRDAAPTIETTIGFIETDRDPAGVRAEFEGFVAIVNKDVSRKFGVLVEKAEELLKRLPWGDGFEKTKFLKPEFTSLDVLAFCSGSLPLGICLPNYDEVRSGVGFKNVDLGNVCSARSKEAYRQFLSPADAELFSNMYAEADQVLTGLHELIGHGSGKLLQEGEDGSRNYPAGELMNPCTGRVVDSHYLPGQTYGSVFGSVASAMEECRAECVSLFLGVHPDIQAIFGFEGEACENSVYVGWLGMCWLGLKALEHYDPEKRSWGAVHGRARYAILRKLLRAGTDGEERLLSYRILDGDVPDVTLSMSRTLIHSVGLPAIRELLLGIQVARCTAAVDMARDFEELTEVPEEFLALRRIVVQRKRPRDIFVQPTTVLDESTGDVSLKLYSATPLGLVQSFVDRYEMR